MNQCVMPLPTHSVCVVASDLCPAERQLSHNSKPFTLLCLSHKESSLIVDYWKVKCSLESHTKQEHPPLVMNIGLKSS